MTALAGSTVMGCRPQALGSKQPSLRITRSVAAVKRTSRAPCVRVLAMEVSAGAARDAHCLGRAVQLCGQCN